MTAALQKFVFKKWDYCNILTCISSISPLSSVKNTDGESSEAAMMKTTFGIFVIRKEGAEPKEGPEDVGIILEGVQVLDELGNVPLAVGMLFAHVYALNLSYPPELRYTFEALQKLIMDTEKLKNTENTTCTLVILIRVNYCSGSSYYI